MDHTLPNPELYNLPFTTDSFNGMPFRPVGSSGLRASAVGLGLWKIGLPETGDGSRAGQETAFRILDRALELGATFWDTANRYDEGSGNSERVIGRWLKANPDQRRNVVLGTKVFGAMDGRTPNHCRLSRANILESVYACLGRLQTDTIDLLYFHAQDPDTPIQESLEAVEDLVGRDLVRYFAISNASVAELKAYQAAASQLSRRCQPIAVQNGFDILHGELPEATGMLTECARGVTAFIAWSPLGRGLLTGRYLDPGQAAKGDRLVDEGSLEKALAGGTAEKLRALADLARQAGLELSQLALAYMLALPGMGPVIPGVTSVEQLESNAAAGKVELSAEQIQQVREILSAGETSTD
jgi:1-deoxyxylulose-5-phosphate synthase